MLLGSPLVKQQYDFTGTGTQELVSNSGNVPPLPLQAIPKIWTLQLSGLNSSGTPQAASAWSLIVEGSIDGINWSQIFNHISGTNADGSIMFSGANDYPVNYIRMRMVSLTLGSASKVRVSLLGVF